jgi:hypothetical protein
MKPKIVSSALVAVLLFHSFAFAGLDSKKAQYVGGTLIQVKEGVEGKLDASDSTHLVFSPDKGGNYSLRYDTVTDLAYGQHAGRRVGATVALGVTTMGIGALPILFSKKRRHYLTINFKNDEGKDQAVVFELGKDLTRSMLATLQARTGKKVEYEDEEARKSGNK